MTTTRKTTTTHTAVKTPAAKKTTASASGTQLPFAPRTAARPFIDKQAVPTAAATKVPPTAADLNLAYSVPGPQSKSNVTGDPTQNLQTFKLDDLALFTKESVFSANASRDVHLFYVGRDDVHDILKYILSRVTVSLYINMFGYDDAELNNILMEKALNPAVTMLITLDLSQAGGVHEKALLDADEKYNLAAYNTHFVVGESLTHQISHTKGFVADGRVAAEGSTNWSSSGEGTFVVQGQAGGAGYKAQNNTQSVITDPDTIVRFQTELIAEHMIAASQKTTVDTPKQAPLADSATPATQAIENQEIAAAAAPAAATAKKAGAKKAAA